MEKITRIKDAIEYLNTHCYNVGNPDYDSLYCCVVNDWFAGLCEYKVYERFFTNGVVIEHKNEFPNNCFDNRVKGKYIKKFANIVKKFSERPELIALL